MFTRAQRREVGGVVVMPSSANVCGRRHACPQIRVITVHMSKTQCNVCCEDFTSNHKQRLQIQINLQLRKLTNSFNSYLKHINIYFSHMLIFIHPRIYLFLVSCCFLYAFKNAHRDRATILQLSTHIYRHSWGFKGIKRHKFMSSQHPTSLIFCLILDNIKKISSEIPVVNSCFTGNKLNSNREKH